MALWVDKHRPNNLDKLDYHADLSLHLKKLVRDQKWQNSLDGAFSRRHAWLKD